MSLILNPATGRYVKADGKIGKNLKNVKNRSINDSSKSHNNMYHIFSYNADHVNERSSTSIPEADINKYLVKVCKKYYSILDESCTLYESDKGLKKLSTLAAEADTSKLIKLVKRLVIYVREFHDKYGSFDGRVILLTDIVRGGEIVG